MFAISLKNLETGTAYVVQVVSSEELANKLCNIYNHEGDVWEYNYYFVEVSDKILFS